MNLKFPKLLAALLTIALLTGGCGLNNTVEPKSVKANNTDNKNVIVTSFYPVYIFTLNIVKDIPNISVINMTKAETGCLHDYQLTTDDIKTLEKARVFVINGANMEAFMDKVTTQIGNLKIVDSSKGIETIKNTSDGESNPHLWLSISNAIEQVKNIGEQLAALDPDNSLRYKSNTDIYVKKLDEERDKILKGLSNIKSRDIITFHEAFPYFAKDFNLNVLGIIEREPGSEPSAGELSHTVDIVNNLGVKVLFAEPQYSTKAAETISRETGAKVFMLDPIVTGPPDIDAYTNIMDNNLKTLQEALR